MTASSARTRAERRRGSSLRHLIGAGHKIALFTLPFAVATVVLDAADPGLLDLGTPGPGPRAASVVVLGVGLVVWAWSVALILVEVPRDELITTGPYAVVKHPLYTGVALLVLPALGVLLGTWVWVIVGLVLYIGSRRFAGEEEDELARRFGERWARYRDGVYVPWL